MALTTLCDKVRHLLLAERQMAGQRRNARIPRHAGPDLKEQVLGFSAVGDFRLGCRDIVADHASDTRGEHDSQRDDKETFCLCFHNRSASIG